MRDRIAVVGLGAMGSAIARRLLTQGRLVTVWNRSPLAAQALGELGAQVAVTPADAARDARVVITMVSDPMALRSVTEGPHGVAATITGSAMLLQMSTVSVSALTRLRDVLPAGAELLDAPVLGSVAEAGNGTLRLLVGGPPAVVEQHQPFLEELGRPLRVGPLGAGTAAKLVANGALFGVLTVLGESLAMGTALGLTRDTLYEVLASTPLKEQAERRRPSLDADEYPARFALSLARKDADLIADEIGRSGIRLGLLEHTRGLLADAERDGRGGQDYTALLAHTLRSAVAGAQQ